MADTTSPRSKPQERLYVSVCIILRTRSRPFSWGDSGDDLGRIKSTRCSNTSDECWSSTRYYHQCHERLELEKGSEYGWVIFLYWCLLILIHPSQCPDEWHPKGERPFREETRHFQGSDWAARWESATLAPSRSSVSCQKARKRNWMCIPTGVPKVWVLVYLSARSFCLLLIMTSNISIARLRANAERGREERANWQCMGDAVTFKGCHSWNAQ